MKKILLLILALFSFNFLYAGTDAGKDSARYYKSNPAEFDGETVDVDCTFLTRINAKLKVEGVAFFIAHTKDDDNDIRGGSIVVAVPEDKASSFLRKYGSMPEINRGSTERVDSKRLRGTFHQLESGAVYIDVYGDTHEVILEHKENAVGSITRGEASSSKAFKKKN